MLPGEELSWSRRSIDGWEYQTFRFLSYQRFSSGSSPRSSAYLPAAYVDS